MTPNLFTQTLVPCMYNIRFCHQSASPQKSQDTAHLPTEGRPWLLGGSSMTSFNPYNHPQTERKADNGGLALLSVWHAFPLSWAPSPPFLFSSLPFLREPHGSHGGPHPRGPFKEG